MVIVIVVAVEAVYFRNYYGINSSSSSSFSVDGRRIFCQEPRWPRMQYTERRHNPIGSHRDNSSNLVGALGL